MQSRLWINIRRAYSINSAQTVSLAFLEKNLEKKLMKVGPLRVLFLFFFSVCFWKSTFIKINELVSEFGVEFNANDSGYLYLVLRKCSNAMFMKSFFFFSFLQDLQIWIMLITVKQREGSLHWEDQILHLWTYAFISRHMWKIRIHK